MVLAAEDRFKAESLTTTELFQNAIYEAQALQRDYSWTKEVCADPWSDIKKFGRRGSK